MKVSIPDVISYYKKNKNNVRLRQAILLYGVNFFGISIGIITSILVTRYLGPKEYGDYKFLTSIFTIATLIFSFGLFQAGNRALVLNNNKDKARELYGAEIIITIVLFLIMYISLFLYGLFDYNLKEKGLSIFFIYLLPFSWVFLLLKYFEVLLQADNRINYLAAVRFWPKVGLMIGALLLVFVITGNEINRHAYIWVFLLTTKVVTFITIIILIRPSFRNLKVRISEIWRYNNSFGFQVYLGSIFGVGFGHLSGILISYFGYNNTGVGFYSLALTVATPLTLIPNVISTTHYKEFSLRNHISARLFKITILLSVAALISIWIICGPFIRFFYGREYEPVINLIILISTGELLHGLADFFNRFLGSHGQGKAIRNSALIVGISLLSLSLILIPSLGEKGAAISRAFTGLIYATNMFVSYRILVKKLKLNE